MKRTFWSLVVSAALSGMAPQVGAGETAAGDRPTLPVFTSAAEVESFCERGLNASREGITRFATLAAGTASLAQWDALGIVMEELGGPISITSATSTEKPVRQAAEDCEQKISELQTQLYQNADVYERLRGIEAKDAIDARVKALTLEAFENAGVALPPETRNRSKTIFDKLTALGIEFERNTRENLAVLSVHPAELEGLPKSYIDSHKPNNKGQVELALNYPDYVPFMDNAVSADARRRYYMTFNQIGGQRNLDILNEASALRKELAGIFGKPSYAEYVISRRMAGSAANVEQFLGTVRSKITEAENRDLEMLRQAKAALLGRPLDEVTIDRWDVSFYIERVRRTKYAIDQDALRKYFPTEASIAWLFDLAQRMYGVRFVKTEVPTWHADVRYYDIFDAKGVRIAGAYLDPFPREGKYNHAAVWPVRGVSTLIGRTPVSVLVTNLDRKGLDHNELETLLHEFGHLLHGTLSKTRYTALSGTSTRTDFVEAPSQMFEQWARNLDSLALIRKHCNDCPAVDAKMVERLNQSRNFAQGIHYSGQHVAAVVDQTITGINPPEVMDVWKRVQGQTPLGYVEGTITPARWGHFANHYSAGYYSYMWSEVMALDMASAWKGKLLDPKVSRRYLDKVLSRGGETAEDAMVRDFLGREPSPEPFFAEITGRARGAQK